jgi:hypothetical protein
MTPLLLIACGGSEPASEDQTETAPAGEPTADTPTRTAAPAPTPDPVPLVRFAAYGPADATYGPSCGTGIEGTGSDIFRLTSPDGWIQRGTGGGTGADDISFEVGGPRVIVDLYATRNELQAERGFEDRGETGTSVDLGGSSFALHEVAVDDRTGYGILNVPWLVGIPGTPDKEGTVLVTSREAGLVTAEEATTVLETVRVERCAAISQILIYSPMSRHMLVPEFEGGDPLGKTRPDEPAPEYVPGESPLLTYSEAQVAYLLPLAEEVAECVAPLVREDAASSPMLHLQVLTPSGTHKETLGAYVERCGGAG